MRTTLARERRIVADDLISVSPRSFFIVTVSIVAILLTASAVLHSIVDLETAKYREVVLFNTFSLDRERNIPTFFNFTLIAIAAAMLAYIARTEYIRGGEGRRHWLGLALLFPMLAFDEAASFHESLNGIVRTELDITGDALYFAWTVPGLFLVSLVGVFYASFLMRLPRIIAVTMFTAGALYVGGAIGMELIGSSIFVAEGDMLNVRFATASMIEETMEMIGMATFSTSLLMFIRWRSDAASSEATA